MRPGRFHYSWVILAMGVLVVFGALGLARFGYTPILPSMQASLGWSNTSAGLVASANLAGYAALALIGGVLASWLGPRSIIALGLLLAGTGMLLMGFAEGFLSAALLRFMTGAGSGLSNVPVMGLLAAWFLSKRRGFASGIVVTGSSFGLILIGLVVPGFLASHGSDAWRAVWVGYGSMTLLLAVLSFVLLRNSPAERNLQAVGEVAPRVMDTAKTPPSSVKLDGVLQWSLIYRSWPVYHLAAIYTAFGFSYFTYMTFFSKYLTSEGGYTPQGAGNLLMLLGWMSLLSGIIWGTLSDVIGRRAALVIVFLIQATSFGLFGLWHSPISFAASAILFGLTAWSIPAIIAATCGDVLGPRMAAAAIGFVTLVFALGQALGPAVAGNIADRTGSFAPAFVLASVVAVLGAIGSALLRPLHSHEVVSRRVLAEADVDVLRSPSGSQQ